MRLTSEPSRPSLAVAPNASDWFSSACGQNLIYDGGRYRTMIEKFTFKVYFSRKMRLYEAISTNAALQSGLFAIRIFCSGGGGGGHFREIMHERLT